MLILLCHVASRNNTNRTSNSAQSIHSEFVKLHSFKNVSLFSDLWITWSSAIVIQNVICNVGTTCSSVLPALLNNLYIQPTPLLIGWSTRSQCHIWLATRRDRSFLHLLQSELLIHYISLIMSKEWALMVYSEILSSKEVCKLFK